jgi:opacity protein-like surface antigen
MKIHRVAAVISILLSLTAVTPAHADERADRAVTGFYGGVSLRERGADSAGVTIGSVNSVWNRYVAPVADELSPRALVFGGYRWRNDIAVEAAFNSSDMYALRPADALVGPRGVGLNFASSAGLGEAQARTWNVDVFTSWTFYRAFALYGRLGYAQSETAPGFGAVPPASSDIRRLRDGVNYGLGVRYDMNTALGLRLEYGRFGRFAGEIGTGLPETDQVSVGVQLRF